MPRCCGRLGEAPPAALAHWGQGMGLFLCGFTQERGIWFGEAPGQAAGTAPQQILDMRGARVWFRKAKTSGSSDLCRTAEAVGELWWGWLRYRSGLVLEGARV